MVKRTGRTFRNDEPGQKTAISEGKEEFPEEYVKKFFDQFEKILMFAGSEHLECGERYYADKERALILRLYEYKDNYLAWVVNFDLPFSNNESERSLRGVKSKLKIAGQFQNEARAKDYAAVKSYIETCYRHGVNETKALIRLYAGRINRNCWRCIKAPLVVML